VGGSELTQAAILTDFGLGEEYVPSPPGYTLLDPPSSPLKLIPLILSKPERQE